MNAGDDIPPLSVVLPVYNGARFLKGALDSILSQDFREFECIVINDGSTDQSPSILEDYRRRDARLHVVHQRNFGLVDTLNRGVSLSRAPLIARMDADDVCLPGRFKTQMQYFLGRDDLAVLGGQIQLIDEEGRLLRLVDYPACGEELKALLYKGSPVAHPAVMLRKAAVEKVGLYRQAFAHAEDYDLWLRLHEAGYAIENLKTPLINYRQHSENVSVVHRRQQQFVTLAAQCAHRVRMAGLPDPTMGLDSLDEKVFDSFPARLMAGFGDQLFALHMGPTSFETEEKLIQQLAAYRRLPVNLRRTRSGVSFLMQTGYSALKLGLYLLTLSAITKALVAGPTEVSLVVSGKVLRFLRGLFSGRCVGKSISRKVSVE
jgi:glycosyltransferase involved in cell wall biosynthesis